MWLAADPPTLPSDLREPERGPAAIPRNHTACELYMAKNTSPELPESTEMAKSSGVLEGFNIKACDEVPGFRLFKYASMTSVPIPLGYRPFSQDAYVRCVSSKPVNSASRPCVAFSTDGNNMADVYDSGDVVEATGNVPPGTCFGVYLALPEAQGG